ncbi:MAG: thiamine pyrophosphate-binding protein [Reyranellaceae bacterium]
MARTALASLVGHLTDRGVRHIFGVPGGDCSLDIMDAATKAGIQFVLCRTETAAGFAAAVTGELTGSIGVVMTTRGPGFVSALNGVAYAHLDRSRLMLIADHYDSELDYVSHQRLDQAAILRPLLRGEARMDSGGFSRDLGELFDLAFAQPNGPIYLEITNRGVTAPVDDAAQRPARPASNALDETALAAIGDALAAAHRPLIIAGLQARDDAASAALRRLAEAWRAPVYTTYCAKGVMPDSHPLAMGHYIGGVGEEKGISEADLIVLYGFDAVECPPGRWRYTAPVIELTRYPFDRRLVEPRVSLCGDLAAIGERLAGAATASAWDSDSLARTKARLREAADSSGPGPISPQMVVDAARKAAPATARIAIDAGAHMLPVLHHWVCDAPRQTLVSRGLATMGFAVPAAIGSCLAEPDRRVIAFTGDGGLMMCAGELATAVQHGCKPVVVVFNDSALTLIGAKQERRQLPGNGVDFSPTSFAQVATGYGCTAFRVERPEDLDPAFEAAFVADRAAVIDVVVNPRAYHRQLVALRG